VARVSKDGRESECCVHPSRRLLRKLLRMRSESACPETVIKAIAACDGLRRGSTPSSCSRLFFSIHEKLGLAPHFRLQPVDVTPSFILGWRIERFALPRSTCRQSGNAIAEKVRRDGGPVRIRSSAS
jgi:hypothetical protein